MGKIVEMRTRAVRPSKSRVIEDLMDDLMDVRNERQKRICNEGNIVNADVTI